MAPLHDSMEAVKPLEHLQPQLPAILQDLEAIVTLEAPSYDLAGLERVARWIAQHFAPLGSLERQETPNGPMLRVLLPGSGHKVLVLCHFDTVHPVGAFAVPWKIEGERAYGPGIYDMKGNIVQLLWALRTNQTLGLGWPQLELLFTPDEEVGSMASRPAIESAARRNDLVLVLEAPMGNGDLKVARKGVGQYRLTAHGKPAHQGVEPEKGINAIVELAQQIQRINTFNDLKNGTSVSVTMIEGGSAGNVIPAKASAYVDTRFLTIRAMNEVKQALSTLEPFIPGAKITLEEIHSREPMEHDERMVRTFAQCLRIGQSIGQTVREDGSGGGSDGNVTAAMGVPTLDGLGPAGDGLHAVYEHVVINSLPQRAALCAAMLRDWVSE